VGNLPLRLHDGGADFAVWCHYKYMNSGPGAVAGAFVHARHAHSERPRFAGWWGHDKETRFLMGPDFLPIAGAEGWQISNPPILQMAALRASLEIFDEVAKKKAAENPLFKKIAESQLAFAKRAVQWDQDTNVSRKMAFDHYFGPNAKKPI